MDEEGRPHAELSPRPQTMKHLVRCADDGLWSLRLLGLLGVCVLGLCPAGPSAPAQVAGPNTAQQMTLAALLSESGVGRFNGVARDAGGDLYLLLDEGDGVRVLKTDAGAANVLAQAHIGAAHDVGLALALDPAGNVYVAGTSSSGALAGTSGAAFPAPNGTTTNSFVAKLSPALTTLFVTFTGSTETVASSVAATADAVFVTGSLFTATLPVTPAGIIQAPAYGSSQNGFVERFSADGSTLVYATYLSGATSVVGASADTVPAAIVADAADNAYIAGETTATGFPTVAALVPRILTTDATGGASGFLIKLNPDGSGITFSSFVPGAGVSGLALDTAAGNLLLTGNLALGQFPVATAQVPLVATPYQVLARVALDGSAVLASTVVAPGSASYVAAGAGGTAWVTGSLSLPVLPLTPLSNEGTGFAAHVGAVGAPGLEGIGTAVVDQTVRLGGAPYSNPTFASLGLTLNGIAEDGSGGATLAGSVSPSAGSGLLASETFDLPLIGSPTSALPSSVADAAPNATTCAGSLCSGSAGYLATIATTNSAALALSVDTAPLVRVRNLGSAEAIGLSLTATGFAVSGTCNSTLAAGAECDEFLSGSGPGSITVTAGDAPSQTVTIPAISTAVAAAVQPLAVTPTELDFGVQTADSASATRVLTITNLDSQPQSFLSTLGSAANTEFSESASDCPVAGTAVATGSEKTLAAGASCHLTLAFSAVAAPGDGIVDGQWTIGSESIALTGFAQAADLNVSSSEVDFGLQFHGGLHPPRFLFLSNNSTNAIAHAAVALPADSPFVVTDQCPSTLEPGTICALGLAYQAATTTSSDAVTLALDQGLSVLVTGETLPQPGVNGTVVNPALSVAPLSVSFANAEVVTGVSGETQTVTVHNTGVTAFSLTIGITGDFTMTTNCGGSLAGGGSCSVIVGFAPSAPGVRDGLLAVTAGAGTSPQYVSLTGTATAILPANNGTIAFGSVPVGEPTIQWFKVSQPFSQLTATATGGDFDVVLVEDAGYGHGQPPITAFQASATGSCSNCWVGILFNPKTVGAQTGALAVTSTVGGSAYQLVLTGTGLPLTGLILTPLAQDFGPVGIGSSSAPALFTLTNLSTADVTVTAPAVTGPFAISSDASGGPACSGTLAVSASCFLEVDFAPTTTGPLSGTLTVATSAGSVSASLSGYGAVSTGLTLNPNALVFGNVPGTSATVQTITLANTGSAQLQVGTPTADNAAFSVASACGALAPGANCTITVTFTPAAATAAGTLSIPVASTVGGNTTQTTATVALSGTYTTEDSGLQILPGEAVYGPYLTGAMGLVRQFTLNNLTSAAVTVTLTLPRQFVLIDGGTAPCGGLAPNASCTFNVAFLPLMNGDVTGTIFAEAQPVGGGAALNGLAYLEGYGIGGGVLSVTGNISTGELVNFGQVASGQSVAQTLTLTNAGSGTLTIRRITSEWPFLATSTCGTTLAAGASCTATVTYTPLNQVSSSSSGGSRTDAGTLVIESDATSSPDGIDLTGEAAPVTVSSPANNAPLVAFAATQNSLTFAQTQVGNLSAPQTVNLDNTGTATVHITGFTTTPDFSVQSPCTTLLPGGSCTLTVYFNPQQAAATAPAAGPRYGAIEIASDASTSLEFISLIGVATPSGVVLAPTSLDFGSVQVGTSATLPVQVTNNLTLPAYFQGVSATGDFAVSGTCPAVGSPLAANTSCTVEVTFSPTAAGTRTGTLSVQTDATTLPLTATLTGIGTQSGLTVTPAALSFGSILLGASANLTVTLTNAGTAPVTNLALAITGDYALTVPCSGSTLAPGASCVATVTFAPTALGSRPGTLTITSSDPTSPNTIPLSGTGIGNGNFVLTVNGTDPSDTTASATTLSGNPAAYTLTLTPLNGFSGTVVLNCVPITPAQYASCSLLPSSIALAGSPQNAVATINTLTSVTPASTARIRRAGVRSAIALGLLGPGMLMLLSRRRKLGVRLLAWGLAVALLGGVESCGGSGGDPFLRFAPAGTYQYQVSASSTSGVQLTQAVTLNLTITAK